jgi:hypothetical protein
LAVIVIFIVLMFCSSIAALLSSIAGPIIITFAGYQTFALLTKYSGKFGLRYICFLYILSVSIYLLIIDLSSLGFF